MAKKARVLAIRTATHARSATGVLAAAGDSKKSKRGNLEAQYRDMWAHKDKIVRDIRKAQGDGRIDRANRLKGLLQTHLARMNAIATELRKQGRYIAG